MGYQEHVEGKGISSFTISQNGNAVYKKNYNKTKLCLTVLTVLVFCLSTFYIYYSYTAIEICKTKPCLQSTVTLMNCMNKTVDPCEDFYEFACGMFETNYPSYTTSDNSWTDIIMSKVNYKVKKFLSRNNGADEPEAVHKTRKFYTACLNFTEGLISDDSNYYSPLWRLWEELGLDENYLNDTVALDLEIISSKFRKYIDSNIYFGISTIEDPRNSSSHALLSISTFEESSKFKLKNDKMETNNATINENIPKFIEYFQLMTDQLLNRNQTCQKRISNSLLLNTSMELSYFNFEYSKLRHDAFHTEIDIGKIMTLRELQNLTDETQFKFNWTLYLRELFRENEPRVYEQLLENSDDYEIITDNIVFLQNVFSLLSKTPTKIIKMSVLSNAVNNLLKFQIVPETWSPEYCFSLTTERLGMATGYAMVDTLDDSTKAAATEMNDNIIWAFHKMISESSWMDDETKNATHRKLDYTKTYFGYPNNYTNILNDLYKNLNITENHLENLISITRFHSKKLWNNLVQKKDGENKEWKMNPDEVNAYSDPSMNAFFMPAAFLQAPLYHNGLEALNYGMTGSTIGHELSHNYDNTGRLFNEYGNVLQWWTNKSYEEYSRRAGCMIDHYNNILVTMHNDTMYVNGNQTLNENIADVVGLKESYFAYLRYVEKHGQEPRLPGMEKYNSEQLFFLGYAVQFCQYDQSGFEYYDESNLHSPSSVRVRGVLSLTQEFANAWSCPSGTPMNPKKEKCQIW
ncbi:Metallopeptidase, catalytic domain,Peptidase M13, C-terminal domain,Peptidase M13,Peptidase M13, N- [Cinara cedri]|uniref:Metallopeptidase, catalytic domain,Peptidase M13, C-terminal domain,Peptidase M13,Peptidase M13, N n=1 Tax=Cinara cedri TaxID=506608 RepID=A0A5E4N6N9_9HEMI|nr:Metallopeptidase, catalytic domain,Peptidase M13, C-terminal domain,Peptidase M13,Peptidase M13, N- [Cinara cedri]